MLLKYRCFFTIIIVVLLLVQCNDEPTELGLGILPEGDLLALSSADSLTIHGSNVYPNELYPSGDDIMIGTYNDPVFGITRASLLTEFGPVRNKLIPLPPSGTKIADSLTIYLRWMNNYYGSSSESVNMQVFLLKDTLSSSVRYHKGNFNLTDFVDPTPVMEKTVNLALQDTVITLLLPQSYADALASIDSIDYTDNTRFRAALNRIHLNGFYIKTTDAHGQGTIATFTFNDPSRNPLDSVSYNLLFTYHTEKNPEHSDFWFTFSSYASDNHILNKKNYFYPKINFVEHDYSSTNFFNELNEGQVDTLLYVQAQYGVKVKLDMSVLDTLVNDDKSSIIDVAQAELIVPSDTTLFGNDNTYASSLTIPTRLSIGVPVSISNSNVVIPFSAYFKPYNEASIDGSWNRKAYIFNISQYVQEYLNKQTNIKELFIQVPASDFQLEGVNLKRSNIKLNIKYSKFKTK